MALLYHHSSRQTPTSTYRYPYKHNRIFVLCYSLQLCSIDPLGSKLVISSQRLSHRAFQPRKYRSYGKEKTRGPWQTTGSSSLLKKTALKQRSAVLVSDSTSRDYGSSLRDSRSR